MMKLVCLPKICRYLLLPLAFLLAGCASQVAQTPAAQPTRDLALEQSFEQQLQTINPTAVPVFHAATAAMDAGDLQKSKQLYEKVVELAPSFAVSYRRLGYLVPTDDLAEAERLTRKALELSPDGYNQAALAVILLRKNTPKDGMDAFKLASEAVKALPDDEQANAALVISAGMVNELTVIRQADQHLLELQPTSPIGHYYAGLIAGTDGKWEEAESELLRSQDLGMTPQAVQNALGQGISRNALLSRLLRFGVIALVAWLLGLGGLYLAGVLLSRATMRTLQTSGVSANLQVSPEERRIRSVYRTLIIVLSLYFYISIPFVILTLFLVVGGAFYIFLMIGSIPIQLSIILVIMFVASLIALARGLFMRIADVPPGRLLRKMDAPELWLLVEDVARKLQVRPVDTIYINPGVDIAVNEKGGILQKLRRAGKRNLILGMGVLQGLTQGQLAAILAHEYGHFSNQDTAGGDLAYQVFASVQQVAERLVRGRAAQIFNPVWLFLVAYQRIFLQVTLGASRLQEVLADRYAASTYGGYNFIEGLRGVIRQTILFPLQANNELHKSFELKQPVNNLYNLPPLPDELKGQVEEQFAQAMNRTTSQYDSHPAPQERIALIQRLNVPDSPVHDNSRPALDLFPNPEELQREMTNCVLQSLQNK